MSRSLRGLHLLRRGALWWRHHGTASSLRKAVRLLVDRRHPSRRSYESWCAAQHADAAMGDGAGRPLLTVIVPVLDPRPEHLLELAHSVLGQPVPKELLLVDAGCRAPAVQKVLAGLATHPDVRVVSAGEPARALGISAATHLGVRTARGAVLLFADHDDRLAEGILARVADAFAEHPALDLLSTDEDQIAQDGGRTAPVFRPGPSPWLLLGFNAATHLVALRAELFERAGGLRPERDGAQDHDLLLRAWEHARHVGHLHAIGYHWRRAPGSVSDSSTNKPWAFAAGLAAVRDAVARRGLPVDVVGHGDPRGVYVWRPRADADAPARRPLVVLAGAAADCAAWERALRAGDTRRAGDAPSARDTRTGDAHDALDVAHVAHVANASPQASHGAPWTSTRRWPTSLPEDGLLVVDAALRPEPRLLAEFLRWTQLPGVRGVACASVQRGRRAHLGYSVTRDGWAAPVLPGLSVRAAGPALLAAAPREVATSAGGLLWLASVPVRALADLANQVPRAADVLVLGLLPAIERSALLFVPALQPEDAPSAERRAAPVDLEASALWPDVRARLPETFWAGGADRFCPRHPLLTELGLPPPAEDGARLSLADARSALGRAPAEATRNEPGTPTFPAAHPPRGYSSPASQTTV